MSKPLNQEAREITGNYLLGMKVAKGIALIVENAEKEDYLGEESYIFQSG